MTEQKSDRERVVEAHAEHPDWTARQIADDLGVERHTVYNNARAAGITLAAAPLPALIPKRPPPAVTDRAPEGGGSVDEFTVFADSPAAMVAAQAHMIAWCDDKIAAAAVEQEDARRNAVEGSASGFSTGGWDDQVRKVGRRIDFYEKVKAALQAGYYIVPPFPMDVFAIRTKAANPRGDWKRGNTSWDHRQTEQMLPAGEGRYVNPIPTILSESFPEPDGKGGEKLVKHYKPADFLDVVDFPFRLARAEVMNATAAAMGLKIFDRMGVLPVRKSPDPITCGQILMPHRGKEPLTFFVTWWLDTRTL